MNFCTGFKGKSSVKPDFYGRTWWTDLLYFGVIYFMLLLVSFRPHSARAWDGCLLRLQSTQHKSLWKREEVPKYG